MYISDLIKLNKKKQVLYKTNQVTEISDKQIWRIKDVSQFLGVSIGHIYNLVSRSDIPYRKKGKLLYFIPSEIFDWINEGNIK